MNYRTNSLYIAKSIASIQGGGQGACIPLDFLPLPNFKKKPLLGNIFIENAFLAYLHYKTEKTRICTSP
jgi:hypothetical protein